jgi:hypothetical protein
MSEFPPRPDADDLAQTLRRVRAAAAERAARTADSRADERLRLEALLARIEAALADAGPGAELFDPGVTQGFPRRGAPGRSRLFLDALAFFEARRGGRGFRLFQDSRWGRLTLGEADDAEEATRLALDYCARRLLERERALVSDQTVEEAARRLLTETSGATARNHGLAPLASPVSTTANASPPAASTAQSASDPAAPTMRRIPSFAFPSLRLPSFSRAAVGSLGETAPRATAPTGGGLAERGLLFVIQLLGSAALTLIVALAMWWAWKAVAPPL